MFYVGAPTIAQNVGASTIEQNVERLQMRLVDCGEFYIEVKLSLSRLKSLFHVEQNAF